MFTQVHGLKLGGHVPWIKSPCWGHAYFSSIVFFFFVSSLCKNETGFKHSLSLFQACVKMKPFPFYLLWLPFYQPVFLDEPWFPHSIVTICSADHMPSLGCFTNSWGTSAMSGLFSQPLNLYLFWVVPPSPEPISTHNTTHCSRRSNLSALFWLIKFEKIVETLVVLKSLNGYEKISTQYTLAPSSGWDGLFTKKEYLSLSRLRGSFRYCFLPFQIWGTIHENGHDGVFFSAFFSNSLNMKRLSSHLSFLSR